MSCAQSAARRVARKVQCHTTDLPVRARHSLPTLVQQLEVLAPEVLPAVLERRRPQVLCLVLRAGRPDDQVHQLVVTSVGLLEIRGLALRRGVALFGSAVAHAGWMWWVGRWGGGLESWAVSAGCGRPAAGLASLGLVHGARARAAETRTLSQRSAAQLSRASGCADSWGAPQRSRLAAYSCTRYACATVRPLCHRPKFTESANRICRVAGRVARIVHPAGMPESLERRPRRVGRVTPCPRRRRWRMPGVSPCAIQPTFATHLVLGHLSPLHDHLWQHL